MTTTKKASLGPWTDDENRAIVALYFIMLDRALYRQPYNKAAMIRNVKGTDSTPTAAHPLAARSRGSVELKLMNCSAAHRDIGTESGGNPVTMDGFGYRALPNYQATLKAAMATGIVSNATRPMHHPGDPVAIQ